MADYQVPAFNVFRDLLTSFVGFTTDDAAMLQELYNASTNYMKDGIDSSLIPDLMANSPDAPASFKAYMGQFNNIKNLDIGITTIKELNQARSTYKATLRYYGLSDLATNDVADKFMTNKVSADEAAARMQVAYDAVNGADAALKEQLKTYFPSLSSTDIVKTILNAGETVSSLQTKIGTAGIKAEAATAGIQSTLNANELYAQGVTRQDARKGYQQLAQELPATTAAAERAGIDTQNLQTELEKESLLGLASQRRKKAQAAEQNLFSGSSGTAGISLNKSSVGKF